jgi:uncharacterized protein with HEPN domain
MQEAITLALKMASERNRQDLTSDSMLAMALTRCLEVLGEAASKLSDQVRLRFPGIPFAKMISMRNRLIAYFDVDLDIVWTTVSEDLPSLQPVLESILAQIDR